MWVGCNICLSLMSGQASVSVSRYNWMHLHALQNRLHLHCLHTRVYGWLPPGDCPLLVYYEYLTISQVTVYNKGISRDCTTVFHLDDTIEFICIDYWTDFFYIRCTTVCSYIEGITDCISIDSSSHCRCINWHVLACASICMCIYLHWLQSNAHWSHKWLLHRFSN